MKNYINNTLEQLENDYWKDYNFETNLIKNCHEYRKIKLKDLTVEQIRLLIGQNIGLKYLIPIALDFLDNNILCEGDLYEGGLLSNILKVENEYWLSNYKSYKILINLFEKNIDYINNFDTIKSIKEELFQSYNELKEIKKKVRKQAKK
jgi:hypothetical protein